MARSLTLRRSKTLGIVIPDLMHSFFAEIVAGVESVAPRIDAVCAANDPSAIGVMKAVWAAGLGVPDDIAGAGAGDIALGDLLRVPLTTVSWSREDQGTAAAPLLFEQIDDESERRAGRPRRTVIPPRLIQRRSSGSREAVQQ